MVMVKDRVMLEGLTASMWTDEHNERVKSFLSNAEDKILVLRISNDSLVSTTHYMVLFCRIPFFLVDELFFLILSINLSILCCLETVVEASLHLT